MLFHLESVSDAFSINRQTATTNTVHVRACWRIARITATDRRIAITAIVVVANVANAAIISNSAMISRHIIFIAACVSVTLLITSTPSAAFCAQWESTRDCRELARWGQPHHCNCAPASTLLLASSSSPSSASAKSSVQPKSKAKPRTTQTKTERRTPAASTGNKDISTSAAPIPRKPNLHVRSLMHTIRSHFEDANNRGVSSTKAWAATRAYVYFAADTLSLKQAQEVLDFLSSICPASTAKKVVQVAAPVLTKDVSKFLAPASEHFINVLGNEAFQKEIDDDPQHWLSNVKSYHSEVAWNKLVRHLCDDWGMSSRAINKLKASTVVISTKSTARINASLTYLDSVMDTEWLEKRKKTTSTIAEQLIMHWPTALLSDTNAVLKPRVEYLMRRLNMTETDFTVFLNRGGGGPLACSSEDKIRPMLEYLQTMLNQQELKNCVMKMPFLLTLAIETLQSRVEFFDDIERRHFSRWSSHTPNVQTEVEERSLAVCILATGPTVFSLDFSTNVQPKIDFISKVWGEASLVRNLRQRPTLMSMNVESNLKPSLDFYNRTGYVFLSDDWEICQQETALSLAYVATSLKSRLLPRWYFVRSQNPSYRPSLSSICTDTDGRFCKCAGLDLEQYLEFKKEHGPDLELPDPSDLQLDE